MTFQADVSCRKAINMHFTGVLSWICIPQGYAVENQLQSGGNGSDSLSSTLELDIIRRLRSFQTRP
jgi:hypothetical protein